MRQKKGRVGKTDPKKKRKKEKEACLYSKATRGDSLGSEKSKVQKPPRRSSRDTPKIRGRYHRAWLSYWVVTVLPPAEPAKHPR